MTAHSTSSHPYPDFREHKWCHVPWDAYFSIYLIALYCFHQVCEKSEHNRVQLCIFWLVFLKINQCWSVSFETNWSNMHIIRSRMSTNWSSRQIIRSKRGLSVTSFFSGENARVVAKILPELPATHYRKYTRVRRTSNIVALHLWCEENGWNDYHNNWEMCFKHILWSQPESK